MERLVCLALICVASALAQGPVDPRGARPVVPNTRSDKCDTKREWPFCTDDDWGHKCPSGCRIQGLLDKFDHESLKSIEKIRNLLDQNRAKHRSTDQATKQTYDFLKDKLLIDAGNDNSYFELAQNLRQRITEMKIKIDRQLRILAALKDRVKDQVNEMQKLEVDIDIKLRSCKGSCASYTEFQVDRESFVSLEKQVNHLDNQAPQESAGSLYVMKSRPLQQVLVDSVYKSKGTAEQQRQNVFPEVDTVSLVLEEEGSSSSPATISKVPGTSLSSSASSGSSSGSSSSSSKSITQLGGGDLFGHTTHTSTSTITCTKRTRTTVVHTKDGPQERVEEVIEGGPECQSMGDLDPSGTSSSSSFSSSSSSSSSFHSGGTKGSLLGDVKAGFGDPFGHDLGGFMMGHGHDDLPDFQARSVKSMRVERQADYIGQVCMKLKQQSQHVRQPFTRGRSYRRPQCRAKADVPMCWDDDWVSKCPSGCRLQGLITKMDSEVEKKLWKVCQTGGTYEDAAKRSMKAMTHIYSHNRRVLVNRYMSDLKFVEHAERLAGNLTALRDRSSMLSQQLEEMNHRVLRQIEDLYRAEVDIDMKLRACKGSCQSVIPFDVGHPSYEALHNDMQQLDKTFQHRSAAVPPQDIPHLKLQPVDIDPVSSPEYKTIPTVQRELLTQFEDIGQNRVVLDQLLEDSEAVDAEIIF